MEGSQQNTENERQHLLDRLLDAVKQCQLRFGGKTELASDGDSRQVGQVAGIVKLDCESGFWSFVKVHLGKLEEERFLSLQKATSDAGRGRAWLRSSLNERSLEKYFHHMLGNRTVISQFYEKEAFLMNDELASMLPMIAAGLSSILFALTVDSDELNIVRPQPPPLAISKDVFSGLLPSFPTKPVSEPAPVYSASLIADHSKQEKKKKKRKKKLSAAIVCIEEDGSCQDSHLGDSSMLEARNIGSDQSKSSNLERTLPSYPSKNTKVPEEMTGKTALADGQEIVCTELAKSVSLPDNPGLLGNDSDVHETKNKNVVFDFQDFLENVTVENDTLDVREEMSEKSESPFLALEPESNALRNGGEQLPTVEDTSNFVIEGPALFHGKSDEDGKDMSSLFPLQNEKQTSSTSFALNEAETLNQGSYKGNEKDFLHTQLHLRNEDFDTNCPNSLATQNPMDCKEGTALTKQNSDECNDVDVNGNKEEDSNFSFAQTQADSSHENFQPTGDHYRGNESHISSSPSAQDHQSNFDSTSGDKLEIERTVENVDIYENASNKFNNNFNSVKFRTITSRVSSGSDNDVETMFLMDNGECLLPVSQENLILQARSESPGNHAWDVSTDKDRDSLSSADHSWSYVDDTEDVIEQKDDHNSVLSGSSVAMASDTSTAAALAACSDAQRGMDSINSGGFICMQETMRGQSVNENISKKSDGMSLGELKQAIVSMMLKKDEIEEQNRGLRNQLDEERLKSQMLGAKSEQLQNELAKQENLNAAKIESLSRENELLKHQLKKYVGAVQALRTNMQSRSPDTVEVLSGIRQDEILPSLPPEKSSEQAKLSEEVEEYKRKLIQVADLHGELLEFNDRLQKQLNYCQYKVRRLREELVHLRGPLPEDVEGPEDEEAILSDFDPVVMSVGTRPLVNVWVPSVFLRGRSSNVHHVYQVYVRIKDDEWNVYRRYSQFFDVHKSLRRKFPVVETFKFPPKKRLGNKDSLFVEDRRRLLQDYLRRVVNLFVTTDQELRENTTKAVLLQIFPFFAEPFPPEKAKNEMASRRKRSLNYTGL
ncbi:Sorting nexin-29 [Acropora cervicornis]|uniref:Sorting nexin-29 n=1 Tax=Acropora cervicornis TaxID=6130 RepID=A0AAD9QX45_ACRCE|nr:Sorting nexin-29 [Acropora cervicornis]